jgi:NAD(P)-dependent dehydrogenase (short-subunit alcohol dehydrogenase family)
MAQSQGDPFRGRVAVITGGAGGIGMALATAMARRGARLVLADLDEGGVADAARALRAQGADVLGVPTDVTDRAQVRALADAAIAHFGAVHIVCNNAGVATVGDVLDATPRDWEFAMGVNFWGVVHGVQTFAPILVEQRAGGHIVNTASMAGLVGMQWLGIYCASKFAVVGLTESLHRELRAAGVGVSVLCPMVVDTKINENSIRMRPDRLRNDTVSATPTEAGSLVGGTVTADEVARRTVRGIERGDFYILTHPEQRELLRRRAARLDRMFEEDQW